MAQFRTSADILDLALTAAGEVINGRSSYETQALGFLNRVHFAIVAGGTIPLGKDLTVEVDEAWSWARAKRPMILELQPKYDTGSVTFTQGSEAGTFSDAPSFSVAGWYIVVSGRDEILRIASHTAASTSFELDGAYPDLSGSLLSFSAVKLDYDLTPDYIVIDSTNNKVPFKKTDGGSVIVATLTSGTYTPSALATHVASAMTTAAAGPTITGSYDPVTKFFSFTSDGAGATVLQFFFATGTSQAQSAHKVLGFDDEDLTGALTYSSTYILGGIARLVEPIKIHKGSIGTGSIASLDAEAFQRDYPLNRISERYPDRFSVVRKGPDGSLTIRMNAFPHEKTRIEVEYTPVPRDIKDSSGSVPLIPRKHSDVLEDAVAFYICFLKNDDKMQVFASLVAGKISAMVSQHRGSLLRAGENFGQIIPRLDNVRYSRRRFLFPEEPY